MTAVHGAADAQPSVTSGRTRHLLRDPSVRASETGARGDGPDRARARTDVVRGRPVDDRTRCIHYAGALDVVALAFPCCDGWFPCHACHAETADHTASVWPRGSGETHAVLCGACGSTMSIATYLQVAGCPSCEHPFNPGCRLHRHLYFADDAACADGVSTT